MSETVVPDGWEVKCIGDVSTPKRGISYKASELGETNQGLPLYLNMKSFLKDGGYNKKGDKYFKPKYRESDLWLENDLLLANTDVTPTGDILGVPLLIPANKKNQDILYSHHVTAFNISSSIFLEFIYYQFCSSLVRREMHKNGRGTTVKMLDVPSILKFKIPVPPLPEQQKIASILTSVDEVIQKTQSQIHKLQDLKKGTMNELLTQGIGHTEFKDSPVGRIPKEWEVKKLDDLSDFITSGSRGWAKYYSSEGALFIRIGNLTREHLNFRFDDTVYVSPPESSEGKRTRVQNGDILISITADLGIIAVANDNLGEAYVNQHISLVRIKDKGCILPRWIGQYLSSENAQKMFIISNDSGAKAGLNLSTIRKTFVAIPPLPEQQKIATTLSSIDTNIEEKKRKLEQTKSLKKSLMQDLLTGKVRVLLH